MKRVFCSCALSLLVLAVAAADRGNQPVFQIREVLDAPTVDSEQVVLIHQTSAKAQPVKIRIATIFSIGLHELPPPITKFLKDNPEVDVHVEYRSANQVYEDVLGDIVDLGLVSYPGKNSNLKFVPLWKEVLQEYSGRF